MDEVIWQDNEEFKGVLNHMRTGTMDHQAAEFCITCSLSSISPDERKLFENEAIFIMPTWKQTHCISNKYLQKLNKPVARMDCTYNHPDCVNHAKSE
jgi:hypothetical protein